MEPIVHFASSKTHYTADACVLWCFDDRFSDLLAAFVKQMGWQHIDLVKIAGGAQALAGGPSPERDFVIDQIQKSLKLHNPKRVVLMVHRDCGAYGGSKSFADAEAERSHHERELFAASNFLDDALPDDVKVSTYFADFDGLYADQYLREPATASS